QTYEQTKGYGSFNPVWSPDAKKIVYSRKYQANRDGRDITLQKIWMISFENNEGFGEIINNDEDELIIESYPGWTPDGKKVSYIQAKDRKNSLVSVTLKNSHADFTEVEEVF